LGDEELAKRLTPFFAKAGLEVELDLLLKIVPIIKERITTLDEAVDMAGFFLKTMWIMNRESWLAKDWMLKVPKRYFGSVTTSYAV